jgi:hypothetical protein
MKRQGRKHSHRKASRKQARTDAPRQVEADGAGYDWGWPAPELASGNTELARRLTAGGFIGCSYGHFSVDAPPFLALLGENVAEMRSAFKLMHELVDQVGPNAICIEILFDDPGYVISIAQQPNLLKWRLRGIDPDDDAIVLGVNLIKRMDTRNSFLDDLANYSMKPIAPVYLTVGGVPRGVDKRLSELDPKSLPAFEKNWLLLPGISVFRRIEDRPPNSMVFLQRELPARKERGGPPAPASDAAAVAERRQRRLLDTMPKTIHVLRHRADGRALVAQCSSFGNASWQIEQAVANLRIERQLAYRPRALASRMTMIDGLRHSFVEPASLMFDAAQTPTATVLKQIALDAAYLIRRVDKDRPVPEGLAGLNVRLEELGYA